MKTALNSLVTFIISSVLTAAVYAAAPVVDESENYALLNNDNQTAYQKNEDSEEALVREQPTSATNSVDWLNKIKGLQQEIQELRGELEVQSHALKQLQQQQLTFYKDLDARLKTGPAPSIVQKTPSLKRINSDNELNLDTNDLSNLPENSTALISHNNPANEQISYLAAYDLVKDKQFDEALIAMQRFVMNYPHGGYTANAHYWLGELYMVRKEYPKAIVHFETVLKQFPTSSKSAACSLKIGYALAASGHTAEAKTRLSQVINNYPDTPTAQLAATRLRVLNAS